MKLPDVSFAHVRPLTDDTGILEHAWLTLPRREYGYNVDDVARALIAICRQTEPADDLVGLAHRYLSFLRRALRDDGRYHDRLSFSRAWDDEVGSDDCHGRALWSLGVAARAGPSEAIRAAPRRCSTSVPA